MRDAIGALEKNTSAEVVVAVRSASGSYRHVDYLVGYLAALVALLVFLFHPEPFAYDFFPIVMTACFELGAVVSARLPPLRRGLTRAGSREAQVITAARSTFLELKVDTTRRRTGVLVYVSLLERRVEIIADRGVPWSDVSAGRTDVERAFARTFMPLATDLSAFLESLDRLGRVLSGMCPRTSDDINELPDDVQDP